MENKHCRVRPFPRRGLAVPIAALLLLAASAKAYAAQVNVPLNVDYMVLDAAIRQRLYTGPGGRAEFWRSPGDCGHFYAQDPRFSRHGNTIQLRTNSDLNLALDVAGQCLNAIEWSGIIQADTAPYIDGLALKFRIVDLNFYNSESAREPIGGRALNLAKGNLIPRLETFSYDLAPYVRQLNASLESASGADQQIRSAFASFRLGSQVIAQDDGASLTIEFTIPDRLLMPPSSERGLMPAEMAVWRAALANADQLLQTAAAQIGDFVVGETRSELALVMADARSRIERAANNPPPGGDPLPLIRPDWERLRAIVKATAHRGNLGPQTLEVLSFISAGEAIFALDQEQPALGSHIARAGLGEMARGIQPDTITPRSAESPL